MSETEKPLKRMAELSAYVRDEDGDIKPKTESLSKSGGSADD